MNDKVLKHYLEFSVYTNPSLYKEELKNLPDDVLELGKLVRSNIIHRTTLVVGKRLALILKGSVKREQKSG